MNYRLVIGSALMLGIVYWCSADENQGSGVVQTEKTTAGVILEYSQESAGKPKQQDVTKKDPSSSSTGSSVELIVGGQGEDGVAKRKEVPVRK